MKRKFTLFRIKPWAWGGGEVVSRTKEINAEPGRTIYMIVLLCVCVCLCLRQGLKGNKEAGNVTGLLQRVWWHIIVERREVCSSSYIHFTQVNLSDLLQSSSLDEFKAGDAQGRSGVLGTG